MSTRFPKQLTQVRGGPQFAARLATEPAWAQFGQRGFGAVVTERRSSWVRRYASPAGDFHIKTYEYATWDDRWRGLWRHTGPFSRSRAAREFDALCWLGQNAPPAVEPVAVFEERRLGMVHRAILVTRTAPGEALAHWLPNHTDTAERKAVATALGRYVGHLHRLGFRCGNLDLRNILVHRERCGDWRLQLIDSPRFRLRPQGRCPDARSAADWRRLLPQLLPFDLAMTVREAAESTGKT